MSMLASRALVGALLVLLAAPAALPTAAACHDGYFTRGTPQYTEVVGVGPNSVGVYVVHQEWNNNPNTSFGCDGETWAEQCPKLAPEPLTTVGTPGVVVPEIRVLGMVVVPETTVLPPGAVAVPAADDACLVVPAYVGVYANSVEFGTDDLLP